jgi:hypothetical protein
MSFPPYMIYMKSANLKEDRPRGFTLWIPLFIVVPILIILALALFLILLPFLLIAFIFTWNLWSWHTFWHGIPAIFRIFHSLKGTNVDIEDNKQLIHVKIL